MRALRFLNIAVLSVLVGSAALVYSQDEKQQDDKKQEEPKAQPKQDEAKPAHQDEPKQDMRGEKQDQKQASEDSRENAKPEERKQENMDTHAAKQEQGHPEQMGNAHTAGKGGRIPDDKFRAHYGQAHHFNARTVISQGQTQFAYGGYSFQFVDAWPVGWGYTDDCYVDYIDGEYFLIDLAHPGARLALIVIL